MRKLLATGLGTGYLPIAPGTWGSAAAVVVYLAVAWTAGFWAATAAMVAVAVLSGIACVATSPFAEQHFGRKDPSQVTIDEWAGQALALVAVPLAPVASPCWALAITAFLCFVLFRVFDIFKPPPAYQLQRLPTGWGILVDDLVAGAYANLVAQLVLRVVWPMLG